MPTFEIGIEEGKLVYSLEQLDLDVGGRKEAGSLKHASVERSGAKTAGNRKELHLMRLVPIGGGAGIDVQRYRQQHGGEWRVLHDMLYRRQGGCDFTFRHFED
jgi:hypothetical protein